MASDRHSLRAIVVQTLFAWEFREGEIKDLLTYNLLNGASHLPENLYAYELLDKVLDKLDEIKALIAKYAPEWPYEKIARIDRAVLLVGIEEIMFDDQIPDLVAINEAIELAKEFGTENSSKFVNGVLSSVYDDQKKKNEGS